ncbi:PTS mannose/fructose/sorbose/N-acetylgalactosamine transporter subunit IIC [Lentilactobacillus hilgardii]|uniref:PTS mannose/fructose/sorbose/N-acetylgalactosamine transporter subunit IIC n=1 Tax=Lentilactobacillus hilgardii TaxID=1588 RepID=UPI0021C41366|nr:PTS sugar transporter subunit IIC [Lentilactobacillus hilgardii]MCP9334418.1 PTS sugar transporter subunit IIC [Lentilactobacillus hilgardii]MCP9350999.1 PTS sugar transporter subunit IIC [Lentilactobacillus hilgardii]
MTIFQAILIGCVAGMTQLDGLLFGECKLREPIITGFLVGLILGDVPKGLIIGAELQLMWMGAVNVGPTAQLDIGAGGTIGATVAILTGKGAAAAIMFGVPVSVLMQFVNTLLMTGYSGLMGKVDKDIDLGKFSSIPRIHFLCVFTTFFMYFASTALSVYFGDSLFKEIVNGLPNWVNNGMNAVAALLPCVGFALLLNIIMEKKLIPYLILGFIPAAFVGEDLNMVAIVLMAFAIAWIIFQLYSDLKPERNADDSSSNSGNNNEDEWED